MAQPITLMSLSVARRRSPRRLAWLRHLIARPTGFVGLAIVVIVIFAALAAPVLATHDPAKQDWRTRLAPPMSEGRDGSLHILGTDSLGRDIFSRLLYGTRISVAVGFLAVALRGSMGVLLGLISGYRRGVVDSVLMRLADVQLAIPFLVLAVAIMSVVGTGFDKTVLVLGITGWVIYGRVVRSDVLSVREREFVEAARAIGVPGIRIVMRHILPNVSASIIVISTLEVAQMIAAEAALSFLGLGIQPPTPSWGGMVADGRDLIYDQWWVSAWPGLAIFITVLGINLLGDWLRDVLDPTLRGGAVKRQGSS
ncbi:MAG: peptide/nickel transport system permease protein [Thermomicrobiales bacterium]|nr:peptide/nickel transport system permease protein [Thermomicrobiales bacterium]